MRLEVACTPRSRSENEVLREHCRHPGHGSILAAEPWLLGERRQLAASRGSSSLFPVEGCLRQEVFIVPCDSHPAASLCLHRSEQECPVQVRHGLLAMSPEDGVEASILRMQVDPRELAPRELAAYGVELFAGKVRRYRAQGGHVADLQQATMQEDLGLRDLAQFGRISHKSLWALTPAANDTLRRVQTWRDENDADTGASMPRVLTPTVWVAVELAIISGAAMMILDSSLRGPAVGTEVLIAELRERTLIEHDLIETETVAFDAEEVIRRFPAATPWKTGFVLRTAGQHLGSSQTQREQQQIPTWLRRILAALLVMTTIWSLVTLILAVVVLVLVLDQSVSDVPAIIAAAGAAVATCLAAWSRRR